MRFYKDDPKTYKIRYYFCKPEAKRLPFYTRFASGNWAYDHDQEWKGVGEVKGARRTYDKGANPNGWNGQKHCGTKKQFGEGLLRADDDGTRPDCCRPPLQIDANIRFIFPVDVGDPFGIGETLIPYFQNEASKRILKAILHDPADTLPGLVWHLLKNRPVLNWTMLLSDIVEIDYPGYSPSTSIPPYVFNVVQGVTDTFAPSNRPKFSFDPYTPPPTRRYQGVYATWADSGDLVLIAESINPDGILIVPMGPGGEGDTVTVLPHWTFAPDIPP